jgi:hypothetical protein
MHVTLAPDAHHRFDLVCNSQHDTVERPFEWWQTTFRESITAIGRVALVLAPWTDPIPLTRCWCLFEIFTAVAAGEGEGEVELQVRLPASQRPAFVEALAGSFKIVMDTLVRVESQRAEAFLATDQERIRWRRPRPAKARQRRQQRLFTATRPVLRLHLGSMMRRWSTTQRQ